MAKLEECLTWDRSGTVLYSTFGNFREGFIFSKLRPSGNGEIPLSFTDVGKSCPGREFSASQKSLVRLFGKIKFSRKFPNLQYMTVIDTWVDPENSFSVCVCVRGLVVVTRFFSSSMYFTEGCTNNRTQGGSNCILTQGSISVFQVRKCADPRGWGYRSLFLLWIRPCRM